MTLLRLRPLCTAGLALAVALGLGACGGDDPESSSPPTGSSSAPGGSEPDPEEGPEESEESEEPGEGAPAGGVVFVDNVDAPAGTVTVSDGGFEPADTSVGVGDTVMFTTAGGDGIFGVIVGDLDGYTVTTGLDESFRFDEPGTYEVREDVSGNTATVTVE